MTLPALHKTWQGGSSPGGTEFVNQVIPGADQQRVMLLAIRDSFIGFNLLPWTVVGSSDSLVGAMDAVDRWIDPGDLIYITTEGTPFSWIVLEQPGTGAQVCIALNKLLSGDPNQDDFLSITSPSGSFSGGSATVAPTAPDEFNGTVAGWLGDQGVTYTEKTLTCVQSTDGECTRVVIADTALGVPCAAWGFEKPLLPAPDWTDDYFWYFLKTTVASGLSCLRWEVMQESEVFWGRKETIGFTARIAGPMYTTNEIVETPQLGVGTKPQLYGGTLVQRLLADVGPLGGLYDWYWCSRNVTGEHLLDLDTLPLAGDRTFVCVGDCVWGWLDDSATDLSYIAPVPVGTPAVYIGSRVGNQGSSSNTLTVTMGANNAGDLLLAFIYSNGHADGAVITPPAGWTLQQSNTALMNGVPAFKYFYTKISTGAEPGSYDWVFTGIAAHALGTTLVYRPAHATQLDNSSGTITGSASTTHPIPAMTTNFDQAMMVGCWMHDTIGGGGYGGVTTPPGMTVRVAHDGGGIGRSDMALHVFDESGPTFAGEHDAASADTGQPCDSYGFLAAIRAAP
jgi:hypothetical protein